MIYQLRPTPRRPVARKAVTNSTGYVFTPPLEELLALDQCALAAVKNFALTRPKVASVEWIGAVDLRELPLASIDKYVEIGHDESGQAFVAVHAFAEEGERDEGGGEEENVENSSANCALQAGRRGAAAGSHKPLGRCLDRAARVTLSGVFPPDGGAALEEICASQRGWAMESWSDTSGEWKFTVEDFS